VAPAGQLERHKFTWVRSGLAVFSAPLPPCPANAGSAGDLFELPMNWPVWVALSGLGGGGGRGDPARCAGLTWFAPSGRNRTIFTRWVWFGPLGRRKHPSSFFRVSPAVADDRNIFRAEAQSSRSEEITEEPVKVSGFRYCD
jgi:hypothetical protein